ncbi:peptidyl-prolyl cis-trans isomerase-like 2 [Dacryopinax primogenitus]|uniref:Peptidyl-prolyl cis-trans isomerase-like 2 n=1 Tax=Dacryopinax primogenitus (strain DJM 731) TaxID=1858805 RepID=M5FNQ4_DACPD|nr:peptidyl-prolyl cis-trans isomerase-like 2 [Dacryopinax primogenitus]EJT97800.1 peptidyl-prolyl cis-trans isomerase-like 2 [Dacryopinax primogenitus]
MGHGNSNKLYITHAEHTGVAGGQHSASSSGYRAKATGSDLQQLPFDCCALSLQPFENPVVVREPDGTGNVFDLMNIIPWVKKHGTNPVTGKPLASGDLLRLHYHKNPTTGQYHDPVTFKPFNEHSHIVALGTTGNVFSWDTIDTLCIKTKAWRDLVDDSAFKRSDIITLQDPHHVEKRRVANFDHVLKPEEKGKDEAIDKPKPAAVVAGPRKSQQAYNAAGYTNNAASASLTSTASELTTTNTQLLIDEEEFMFEQISAVTKEKDRARMKAYVRMMTNMGGSLNLELHCDRAPKTCYNFLTLARRGYYDGCTFHRLIPGFMVQGGDPLGTGKGGESCWGTPFRDEWDVKGAYKHDARGVVSMANHGAATNGSQFFITFKATPHLDKKHTVFGKLVGGEDVLDRIEAVPTKKGTDTPLSAIKITGIEIFQDPFEEYKARLKRKLDRQAERASEKAAPKEDDRTTWFGTKLGEKGQGLDLSGVGVGRYLKRAAETPLEKGEAPEKKKQKTLGFGDFSSW